MGKSLDTFNSVILRAERLLEHSETIDDDDFQQDMQRSAIVLAVAGFDRYFTHRFAELLVRHLKTRSPSDDLVELLQKAGVDLRLTLKMLAEKQSKPFKTIRNKVQPSLFYLTTQQTKAIDKLFRKVGLHNLTSRVCDKSQKKTLESRVNKAVLRRHSIAHEADLNSHHKTSKIGRKNVNLWLAALKEFVELSDEIIAENLE
jgi:transposase-like protein